MAATRRRAAATAAAPPSHPPAWTPEPWSDGETSALFDAWGPRHARAAGRPLRHADWRACATAVTARRAAAGRAPRTVDQCKNRMDYLKKRLKATDRSRSKGGPPPPPAPVSGSIDRLRALLGLAPSVSPGFTRRGGGRKPKAGDDDGGGETCTVAAPLPRSWPSVPKRPRTAVALLPVSSSSAAGHHHNGGDEGTPCTEVAAALDRLAGTYERVEAAKQKEATRLEERRLEAMRDLEIERMRILVDVAISGSGVADAAVATATAASSSW